MNFYPHHIGDYITATAHLTMIEDGAYRRLLDLYYSTENQLPLDRKALYRVARARTQDEQEAVDIVLEEFFHETETGWFHSRCDEEITKARVVAERARANGRKGGRPPKAKPSDNPTPKQPKTLEAEENNPQETQSVNSGLAKSNPQETQSKPSDNPTPKPPIPIPIPIPNTKETTTAAPPTRAPTHAREASSTSPPLPPDNEKNDILPDGSVRYAVLIRRWERDRGKMSKVTSNDPRLTVWHEKGVTDDQLREAYDMAVDDRDAKGDPAAVNAGFIDVFLASVLSPPEGESALNRMVLPASSKPWQASYTGIEAKAVELGLVQGADELFPHFRQRVYAAASMSPEEKAALRADWGVQV